MRHTNVLNVLASAMNRAFLDVEREPMLQPATETQKETILKKSRNAILDDDARSDMRGNGFWTHNGQAFFDIRVFYPHAASYEKKPSKKYTKYIGMKKNLTTTHASYKLSMAHSLPLSVHPLEALTKRQWLP